MGRENELLNEEIERYINAWRGTPIGVAVRNMYENGASYENICDAMNVDYEDYC